MGGRVGARAQKSNTIEPAKSASPQQKAPLRDWLVVIAGLFGVFMVMMDVSIMNGSLRDVQGSLGTTFDESAWISTAYVIAEIVIIPLCGLLTKVFSPKKYILGTCVVFIISSLYCGLAPDLNQMIFARALQGISGGGLIPMAAFLVITILPTSQRLLGLSFMTLTFSLGPIIGVPIGGWLTVHYSWRYAFFVQIPFAALMTLFISLFMKPQPTNYRLLRQADWLGISMMIVGLGALAYFLDEGNRLEWFSDIGIRLCFFVGIVATAGFLYRSLKIKNPFINISLLKRGRVALICLATFLNGAVIFGIVLLIPRFLIEVAGYNALQIIPSALWYGVAQICITPCIPWLAKLIPGKWLIVIGSVLLGMAAYRNTLVTNLWGVDQLAASQVMRGFGQALITGLMSSLLYQGIEPENVTSLSSISNAIRQLGAAVGISLVTLSIDLRYRFHFARISESLPIDKIGLQDRLNSIAATYSLRGLDDGSLQAISVARRIIDREALVMAYSDTFLFTIVPLAIACFAIICVRSTGAPLTVRKDSH